MVGENTDPTHPLNMIKCYESSNLFRGATDTRSLMTCTDQISNIQRTQELHLHNRRSLFAYASRKSLLNNRKKASLSQSIIPTVGASKGKMNNNYQIRQPAILTTQGENDIKPRPSLDGYGSVSKIKVMNQNKMFSVRSSTI